MSIIESAIHLPYASPARS